ncbi:MAG: hypothetical protein JNM75_00255, partial [Rhodospirillales bacterium]|nr:hypothetical protein [Rhodospirillales bacterium]
QRLRPSLLETSFEMCPYCSGMGVCRTTESTVLSILRKIEEEGQKAKGGAIYVSAAPTVAMYLLNQKRKSLAAMEARFQLNLVIASDGAFAPAEHRLERVKGQTPLAETPAEPVVAEAAEESAEETEKAPASGSGEETAKRSRRRRPRRRRRTDEEARPLVEAEEAGENADEEGDVAADVAIDAAAADADADADAGSEEGMPAEPGDGEAQDELALQDAARKPRRRGKRGGRRRPRRPEAETAGEAADDGASDDAAAGLAAEVDDLTEADAAADPAAEVDDAAEADGGDDESADDQSPDAQPVPLETGVEIGADAVAYGHDLDDDGRDEVAAPADEGMDLEVAFERETPDDGPAPGEVAELADAAAAEGEIGDVSFEIVSYPAAAPAEDGSAGSAWDRDPEAAESDNDRRESSNGDGEPHGEAGPVAHRDDEPDREADGADDEPPAAARTQVIRVGAGGDLTGAPRRGWWQRFMN